MSKRVLLFWFLVVSLVLIIAASIYFILGGFDRVEVIPQGPEKRLIVGKSFKGSVDDTLALSLFNAYRDKFSEDELSSASDRRYANLIVVNFPTDSAELIDQFIGVSLMGTSVQASMDEDIKEFSCSHRFTVFLTQSPIVRPSAEKVEELIIEKAKEFGLEVDFFQELYFSDNSAAIEGWVVD